MPLFRQGGREGGPWLTDGCTQVCKVGLCLSCQWVLSKVTLSFKSCLVFCDLLVRSIHVHRPRIDNVDSVCCNIWVMLSGTRVYCGCSGQGQELDFDDLWGPFQPGLFCDSVTSVLFLPCAWGCCSWGVSGERRES